MMKKKCCCFIILLLMFFAGTAQTISYSREDAYINNPDDFQLVADVAGNHHLLSFSHDEKPELFIYNSQLELVTKTRMPFKYPERASLRIIPFDNFYYVFIHPRFSQRYLLWKVDSRGNCTDMSDALLKLLQTQSSSIKLGFLLIPNKDQLWMVYHTQLDDPEKSTVVMVQTDSLLNVVFTHQVNYEFKMNEEKLQQEVVIFGRYLFVLKTLQSSTSLEVMKVNLATGFTIRNTFHSSGYLYSQPYLDFNTADSTVTVSALLTEPTISGYATKQYVFLTRLNKILKEEVPFTLLKKQFAKNTNTNFLLIDSASKWISLKKWRQQSSAITADNSATVYQDLTQSGSGNQNVDYLNAQLSKMTASSGSSYSDEIGVRFSLLNKDFTIASDSLVPNTKNSYTILSDQYTRFEVNNKEYLLVAQQFFRNKKGLLMVNTNESNQLNYTYAKVKEQYNYLLKKARVIPKQGILVPYLHRREAGLIKIVVE
jgi:hypothetical protein